MPTRLHYILWLQGLLDSTSRDFKDNFDPQREVIGLDMCVMAYNADASLPVLMLNCQEARGLVASILCWAVFKGPIGSLPLQVNHF